MMIPGWCPGFVEKVGRSRRWSRGRPHRDEDSAPPKPGNVFWASKALRIMLHCFLPPGLQSAWLEKEATKPENTQPT